MQTSRAAAQVRGAAGEALARGARQLLHAPAVERVPPTRAVELPGRGTTRVVDLPGPAGAPTVVLHHALGTTAPLAYYPVLDALAQHYRVVAHDQRWHGLGIRSPRFRLEDCADDTAALLDVLGVDRAHVVGYSMGGAVAQLVWRRHPERVASLVLGGTASTFRAGVHERLFFPAVTAVVQGRLPGVGRAGLRACRAAVARHVHPEATVDPAQPPASWGTAELRRTSAFAVAAALEALGRFDTRGWVGEIDVPTAVIAMTKDHTVPVARQRQLAAAIPGARLLEVEAGHGGLVLAADRFRPALLAALAGTALPPPPLRRSA